ncbi:MULTISPECIES: cellulase family glycosylhydrolase [Streptomyces]|uniref:Cellulase family glycosylhydrolase n=1 Tax=Streptomyces koelreuteriae TaxID=2838015 RepID=A0ABX8FJS9_9ACTN|nr:MULTISPECIES: cellulase family glycosylhydrolase [Streptomyces]QWB21367.1 cellulase family glycosylhydrolase [Streptomyces koelreuteriae]UUA04285.1 cellulase family glycosylhydrolase [Streptomyces koelreuteriae]UUA11910.1 cellulase family glycosylhydrolase [Streptomyces sp. CRCS-T-1]
MPTIRVRLLVVLAVLFGSVTVAGVPPATAAPPPDSLWFDDPTVTVRDGRFTDASGREIVLRGYNVSGETKLAENGGLPFASVADAKKSATALRALGGGNTVRFLLSWAYAEPERGQVDTAYLAAATDQMRAFLDAGIRVYPDFHQDLYSRHLFDADSWYTGDGAPKWAVDAGNYPDESCGICLFWGQNITQNEAVKRASYDFWHNAHGVQDAFLATAEKTMTYLRQHLDADRFKGVVGFDPYNEPHAGVYDSGQTSRAWEKDVLWPFYEKFRARMDAAGWRDKPALVEPNLFWNANLDFQKQEGGLLDAGTLGPRYVFNTHFYDQKAISGVFMWGKAADGQYVNDFRTVRDRAAAARTAAVVSEFGHPLAGNVSDKAPTVLKGMYQALDSRLKGADWWSDPAASGPVLSGSQWQWDIYNGRHRELMNGNPDKVLTTGDAWNDEDLSAVRLDDSGKPVLRQDARLLDRLYPSATAGRTVGFTYEDRSRDGSTTLTWNPVPSALPHVQRLVGSGQYGLLLWRSDGGSAPTELHLPASFPTASTTVVSDLGTAHAPPAYTATTPVGVAQEPGGTGSRRLLLTAPDSGVLHYALVTNGATSPSADLLTAARAELTAWAAREAG